MAAVDAPQQSRGKSKHTKKKKGRRLGVRIDMTPMVDVAFLLLTFFMLTTTMSKPQTMEINLPPDKDAKVELAESNLLTVRVSESFVLYWNVGTEKPEKIEFAKLRNFLKERNQANPKLVTLIKIDKKAKYTNMVDIIDELNVADITRFSLAPFTDDDKKAIENI